MLSTALTDPKTIQHDVKVEAAQMQPSKPPETVQEQKLPDVSGITLATILTFDPKQDPQTFTLNVASNECVSINNVVDRIFLHTINSQDLSRTIKWVQLLLLQAITEPGQGGKHIFYLECLNGLQKAQQEQAKSTVEKSIAQLGLEQKEKTGKISTSSTQSQPEQQEAKARSESAAALASYPETSENLIKRTVFIHFPTPQIKVKKGEEKVAYTVKHKNDFSSETIEKFVVDLMKVQDTMASAQAASFANKTEYKVDDLVLTRVLTARDFVAAYDDKEQLVGYMQITGNGYLSCEVTNIVGLSESDQQKREAICKSLVQGIIPSIRGQVITYIEGDNTPSTKIDYATAQATEKAFTESGAKIVRTPDEPTFAVVGTKPVGTHPARLRDQAKETAIKLFKDEQARRLQNSTSALTTSIYASSSSPALAASSAAALTTSPS